MTIDPDVVRKTVAMLGHAESHTVLVRSEPIGEKNAKHGSGTCVHIGGRYFVATCAHAISGAPIAGVNVITGLPAPDAAARVIGANARGGKDQDVDIGWIEILAAHAPVIGRCFLPLVRMHLAAIEDGTQLYACGYPDEQIVPKPIQASKDGQPRRSAIQTGCGIWRPRWGASGWTPARAELIAIERTWSPEERWIRGTRIEHWLRMLREDVPELASAIDPVLREKAGS